MDREKFLFFFTICFTIGSNELNHQNAKNWVLRQTQSNTSWKSKILAILAVEVFEQKIVKLSFSGLNFPNLPFSNFIWLRLAEYLILRILMIHFVRTYCETSYKIKKCSMLLIQTPTRFSFLLTNFFISILMSPKMPNIVESFFLKNPPMYVII